MASHDALGATQDAVAALKAAVSRLRNEYGDTLGIRRLASDVERFAADLDELGSPAPGHRPGPAPHELEEISDEPYDESMWSDAEHEGFGAPDRRAP
jgi:hypothetical protein